MYMCVYIWTRHTFAGSLASFLHKRSESLKVAARKGNLKAFFFLDVLGANKAKCLRTIKFGTFYINRRCQTTPSSTPNPRPHHRTGQGMPPAGHLRPGLFSGVGVGTGPLTWSLLRRFHFFPGWLCTVFIKPNHPCLSSHAGCSHCTGWSGRPVSPPLALLAHSCVLPLK